jgi:hypothetical protein
VGILTYWPILLRKRMILPPFNPPKFRRSL